jgi:hypothetical protein
VRLRPETMLAALARTTLERETQLTGRAAWRSAVGRDSMIPEQQFP